MASVTNPFVDYLSRYTTASPDHEAAFDEFIAQAPPPSGAPLRLETRVESFLRACFSRPDPPSVILTGNAGDGKTYLCRQILAALGAPVAHWDELADHPVERGDLRVHVVKDLSELGTERGVQMLQGLAASWKGESSDRYLIAANEGRLRDLLSRARVPELDQAVDQQLRQGVDAGSPQLVVINLTSVTTSTFVPAVLRWMTHPEHWSACAPCPLLERCPAYFNAQRLTDPLVVERMALLYQLLEHLDIHVTVRDMLIHLAYTLTGDKRCPELQRMASARKDMHELAYYATVWGGAPGSAFRRKASVPQHLEKFHVGEHSLFEVDDFIVSRGEGPVAQAEHDRIFAAGVDLDGRRFAQDRAAYVEGGADRQADEEARILLEWLPHCRRKLFFELRDTERVMQLISFLHIGTYLRLLSGDRDIHDQVRASLVLGLNRAFSRLYLTEDQNLYVTTQYLHSAEQSRPLVRLTLPTSGIMLRVDSRPDEAVDRAWPELSLIFGAPAALILRDPDAARAKQSWHLNLMLFEYLMRLADGGTFNILAAECELIVRALKDNLLSAFAREHDSRDSIEFFVTDRRQYSLKKLRIDEHNTIRTGG